ncbi:hypothetical protein CR513_61716, partial [Mucuna pruriens]
MEPAANSTQLNSFSSLSLNPSANLAAKTDFRGGKAYNRGGWRGLHRCVKSVGRLIADNNILVAFNATQWQCFVKNKLIGRVFQERKGLYQLSGGSFQNSDSSTFISIKESWHRKLDHPRSRVLDEFLMKTKKTRPQHIGQLNKAMYGLKQALRVFYQMKIPCCEPQQSRGGLCYWRVHWSVGDDHGAIESIPFRDGSRKEKGNRHPTAGIDPRRSLTYVEMQGSCPLRNGSIVGGVLGTGGDLALWAYSTLGSPTMITAPLYSVLCAFSPSGASSAVQQLLFR